MPALAVTICVIRDKGEKKKKKKGGVCELGRRRFAASDLDGLAAANAGVSLTEKLETR